MAAVATLRLYELASVVQLGTDRWVFSLPRESFGPAPLGQMSYATAAGLFCGSAGLLSLAFGPWGRHGGRPAVVSGLPLGAMAISTFLLTSC